MTSIIKAKKDDSKLLTDIGKKTFLQSHGHCASAKDVNEYVDKKFNDDTLREELSNPANIYHFIYHDNRPAGYSKIIFNISQSNISQKNITKLERLYLLSEFYGLKLGAELLEFNIALSKRNGEAGMWLFVWLENHQAIRFYKKNGFVITGNFDFKLTETKSNPNHQMFLEY